MQLGQSSKQMFEHDKKQQRISSSSPFQSSFRRLPFVKITWLTKNQEKILILRGNINFHKNLLRDLAI